jgi:hypothetical protein
MVPEAEPLPESASAVCSIEGCWWTASGPWSARAGADHWASTGHTFTIFNPEAARS